MIALSEPTAAPTPPLDAPVTASVAEALREFAEAGNLTPSAVVTAARALDHPLHRFFEWNDGEAAHRYRIEQARTLIRSVRITVERVDLPPVSVPLYIHDPARAEGAAGYISALQLPSAGEAATIHLAREMRAAVERLERAAGYARLAGLEADERRIGAAIAALLD